MRASITPPGSLKARLCVEGRDRLYAYAGERGVPFLNCGKPIVAASAREAQALEELSRRSAANDAGLSAINGDDARRLEPELSAEACAALLSPRTGIIDGRALMLALQGDLESAGGAVVLRAPATAGGPGADGGAEIVVGGAAPARISARVCVNAAGLHAAGLARRFGAGDVAVRFAKGSYFRLQGRAPFSRLVYPAPVDGGLGVHLTFGLDGSARFGPDVEWLDTDDPDALDLSVDPSRAPAFAAAVARYWPGVDVGRLSADFSGVRPKLSGPGAAAADFRIDETSPGFFHLLGVESPGLTAALAIAGEIARRARRTA